MKWKMTVGTSMPYGDDFGETAKKEIAKGVQSVAGEPFEVKVTDTFSSADIVGPTILVGFMVNSPLDPSYPSTMIVRCEIICSGHTPSVYDVIKKVYLYLDSLNKDKHHFSFDILKKDGIQHMKHEGAKYRTFTKSVNVMVDSINDATHDTFDIDELISYVKSI